MIGMPRGLDVAQWLTHMCCEHCEVAAGECASALWGASDRSDWVTGNYCLATTPRREWDWARSMIWDGKTQDETAGAHSHTRRLPLHTLNATRTLKPGHWTLASHGPIFSHCFVLRDGVLKHGMPRDQSSRAGEPHCGSHCHDRTAAPPLPIALPRRHCLFNTPHSAQAAPTCSTTTTAHT